MKVDSMGDVLHHCLRDLLSAEDEFSETLLEMADAAEDEELAREFKTHHVETLEQISRLQRAFLMLGHPVASGGSEAARGLRRQDAILIGESGKARAKDILLAAAGRKTEHYEIASYADTAKIAEESGEEEVAALLRENLNQEIEADERLEGIADRLAAAQGRADRANGGDGQSEGSPSSSSAAQ